MILALENALYNLKSLSLFDSICILIILICLVLCILIYNQNNLKKLSAFKRNVIFLGSFVFIIFSSLLFVNPTEASTNIEKGKTSESKSLIENYKNNEINKLSLNKIIIIGDSRMDLLQENKKVKIPSNIEFIAKSGAAISWLEEVALDKFYAVMDNRNDDYVYHVVVNLGVNDLNHTDNTRIIAKNYYNIYKELFKKYSDVNFYLLSVNPVNDKIINKKIPNNIRSNAKVENLNSLMIEYMNEDHLSNVKYCDSYHNIIFETSDGLHYNTETDQKIIDYITDKCVDYK